jgi:hypothetical protein
VVVVRDAQSNELLASVCTATDTIACSAFQPVVDGAGAPLQAFTQIALAVQFPPRTGRTTLGPPSLVLVFGAMPSTDAELSIAPLNVGATTTIASAVRGIVDWQASPVPVAMPIESALSAAFSDDGGLIVSYDNGSIASGASVIRTRGNPLLPGRTNTIYSDGITSYYAARYLSASTGDRTTGAARVQTYFPRPGLVLSLFRDDEEPTSVIARGPDSAVTALMEQRFAHVVRAFAVKAESGPFYRLAFFPNVELSPLGAHRDFDDQSTMAWALCPTITPTNGGLRGGDLAPRDPSAPLATTDRLQCPSFLVETRGAQLVNNSIGPRLQRAWRAGISPDAMTELVRTMVADVVTQPNWYGPTQDMATHPAWDGTPIPQSDSCTVGAGPSAYYQQFVRQPSTVGP